MVREMVRKVAKSVCICFDGVVMCISKATPGWCVWEISLRKPFSLYLCRNREGHSKRSLTDGIEEDGGQCVVSLDLFLVVGVEVYKRSFTSKIDIIFRAYGTAFREEGVVGDF